LGFLRTANHGYTHHDATGDAQQDKTRDVYIPMHMHLDQIRIDLGSDSKPNQIIVHRALLSIKVQVLCCRIAGS
jgi:hypothetical protein